MRVGILTLHCGGNYGAVLQAASLARAIRAGGHEVEVVDYRTAAGVTYYRRDRLPIRLDTRKAQPLFAAHALKAWRNDRFVEVHTGLSPDTFSDGHELEAYRDRYDAVVAGSDQIWDLSTPRGMDASFFLDWTGDRTTNISYAPSCGPITTFGEHRPEVAALLDRFGALSVRDASSARLVEATTGRAPVQVLDPTFLVEQRELAVAPRRRRPYLAIYGHLRSPQVLRGIREVASRRNLDVVSLGFRNPLADRNRIGLGAAEWLGELAGAELVVTDFYHGLVFSVIFRRPFVALAKEGKVHKVADLLGLLGLEHRSRLDRADEPIDWAPVEAVLEREIARSKRFLTDALVPTSPVVDVVERPVRLPADRLDAPEVPSA